MNSEEGRGIVVGVDPVRDWQPGPDTRALADSSRWTVARPTHQATAAAGSWSDSHARRTCAAQSPQARTG
jgi:hypothetical protein